MTFIPFILAISLLATSINLACGGMGDRIEVWETANQLFRIRITAYAERGLYLSGTYYVFESTRVGSDDWREFITLRHDDRPEIPKDQVRFLDDSTGYVFMGWVYAITTDGGNSWSTWDATKDVPDWQWSKYGVIADVRLNMDGTGTMILKPVGAPSSKVPDLVTKDFGRHWRVN